jgi:hypothetical protein
MLPYAIGGAALLVGFMAGLLTFKVKSRWCPECGTTTLAIEKSRPVVTP